MDGMEDKLNAVLSNPQLMQQIMAMANSLNQGADTQPSAPSVKKQESSLPSLPDIDMNMLKQLSGMAGQGSIDKDQQTLLKALSPYLSRDRLSRLEKAMRAAKMARIASTFLNQGGLSFLTGR